MSEVLMTLGSIRFSVEEGAFQAIRRSLEVVTARMARAGGAVARQILGEDEVIEIRGVVHVTRQDDLYRLESFRDLAREKAAQMLTDGRGNVWGRFVVERVEEEATHHLPNGAPLRQGFVLTLGAAGR